MANIIDTLHPKTSPSDNLYPNIKADNIPSGAVSWAKLANAVKSAITSATPQIFDTSANILALTSNQGVAVATDTGYVYVWDDTNSVYADSGVQYLTNGTNGVYHTDSQLIDENGDNLYPNVDGSVISIEKYNNEDLTLVYSSDWTKLAATRRWCVNYNNLIPAGETVSLGIEGYFTTGGTLTLELWTVNDTTLTLVDTISYTTTSGTAYTFYNEPILTNYTNNTNYPILVTILNNGGVNHQYAQYYTGGVVYSFSDLVSSALDTTNVISMSGLLFRIKLVYVYALDDFISSNKGYVTVKKDGTGDYTTITSAINAVKEGTPILIFDGVYEEEIYMPSVAVNLQGVDRNTCIIRSYTGEYTNPTLYIKSGQLKNLTIEANYVSGTSTEIGTANGAYAVHVESATSEDTTLEIDNCTISSDFSAGLGVGLRPDSKLIVTNSIIINNQVSGRGSYESNGGLGALYVHDSAGDEGASSVVLMNNLFKSNLGTSICIYHVSGQDNNSVSVWAINNVLKDAINNYDDTTIWNRNSGLDYFSIDVGYGNSNSLLNE